MSIPYRATGGHVALIEREKREPPTDADQDPITGIVDSWSDNVLTVTGVDSSELSEGTEVVVSIFGSDALYRTRAVAHWASADRLVMDRIHDVERIQRRRWPRYPVNLIATLASLDGPVSAIQGIPGQTVDIGMGGVRIQAAHRLPPGVDVTVIIAPLDGTQLVARSSVITVTTNEAGFEYRLAFDQLDDLDAANLTALIDTLSSQATPALTNQEVPRTWPMANPTDPSTGAAPVK